MSPSQSLSSHYYPPNEDQGYTHLHALEAERQCRNNHQRERRQLLSSSQGAEILAQRRANYQIQRQMENTSVTNQVEAMDGNLLSGCSETQTSSMYCIYIFFHNFLSNLINKNILLHM
ncbi:hypothetical protein RchiOBHm_Chr1g0349481 [Rosa chinensis]|uniref:Uncharacterized protein n=1 Tax=Rosa chinensis TaxID=74649 RepID=A0A2P6SFS8_ROSCH|nr:hypothetical protein RchiOBHm_Chr1g0349481 [Rosa chinensis]